MDAQIELHNIGDPVADDLADWTEEQVKSLRAKIAARVERVRRELYGNAAQGGVRQPQPPDPGADAGGNPR